MVNDIFGLGHKGGNEDRKSREQVGKVRMEDGNYSSSFSDWKSDKQDLKHTICGFVQVLALES